MLPEVPDTDDALDALRGRLDAWRAGLGTLASRHGIAGEPRVEEAGTLPVFAYPDAVVKLYAPDSASRRYGFLATKGPLPTTSPGSWVTRSPASSIASRYWRCVKRPISWRSTKCSTPSAEPTR